MSATKIAEILKSSAELKIKASSDTALIATISKAADLMIKTHKSGGTITLCGNGGSACDAMHFCEELVARYKRERPGIRARHLMDPGTLTCWGNDYDFDTIFSRQVETLCTPNDLLVAFSTSGNSANIIKALEAARKTKTPTVGLLGKDGGKAKSLCDVSIVIPSSETERIQEVHITLVHIFCELLES